MERKIKREREIIARAQTQPVTVASLTADLQALGLRAGMTVLVHSSLSALGWVCGGPVAAALALEDTLGPEGTLVMPTHSGDLTDPAGWENPPVPQSWWDAIRQTMPPFDPHLTPTRGMGAIAECFRKQAGVVRSSHPQLSFAAWGKQAAYVTANHALDFGLGEESPLARLYSLNAWVLLLGVGHANNTSLHLAEYRAGFPGKKVVEMGVPLVVDGERRWGTLRDIAFDDSDFPAIGAAFAAHTGLEWVGKVGGATARLCPQRPLVDFAAMWMEKYRAEE